MKKRLFAASLLLSSATAFGGGYQLNLQGLRQMAMGGTGTAWTWDAASIFYNPGGLARLNNIQAYGSLNWINPSTAYGNITTTGASTSQRTIPATYTPFNFYVGGPIQQGSKFAIGMGIYTPFGTGLSWDYNWVGKYMVRSIELQTVFFQPTVSYRIGEFMSVGAGFVYATGKFDLQQALPVHGTAANGSDDGSAHLNGGANGVGFNLGVQLKASDNLQFGLTYRSQVNMNLNSGQATFNVPQSLRKMFPNTRFDSRLPLPQVASVGVAWRTNNLTLQLDLNYTGWNSFDSLRINFADHTDQLKDNHTPRHYRNTLTTRVGANYKLGQVVSLMAGAAYDPTPVTDGFVTPDLPDADRIIVSAGISVKPMRRLTILAAIEGLSTATRRNASYDYMNFSGTYKTQAITPGIGVYYIF